MVVIHDSWPSYDEPHILWLVHPDYRVTTIDLLRNSNEPSKVAQISTNGIVELLDIKLEKHLK